MVYENTKENLYTGVLFCFVLFLPLTVDLFYLFVLLTTRLLYLVIVYAFAGNRNTG